MEPSVGFCDLCINSDDSDPQGLRRVLSRLQALGYETVAINRTVDESIFENDRKKKKKSENEVGKSSLPNPMDLMQLKNEFAGKLVILSRLTFEFGDLTKIHTLGQSQNLKKYDLFAVVPKNQTAFQHACSQLAVDVVTIKSSYPQLRFSGKLYLQAVERGVHFEIQYAQLIQQQTRKFAIYHSHLFHTFGKSKNVIISSGATDETILRNPYDIINLASLLGLNETKSKASILGQCKHLLLKAEGRRYGKAVFAIRKDVDNTITENKSDEVHPKKRKKEEL